MAQIIDNHLHKNIELYLVFIQLLSFITFNKVTIFETKKTKLKEQIQNLQQIDPYRL
ncbi:hypothetical protein [Bacillus clarus]|uniref:DNA mismatch repair protein MutT n=1 Tax=Bacillus clarus TaxID=2338372 RepID=A0A090ZGS7_9BACI|nr:hypothetical protein [Bacillus clarus]KFN03451.1 hypothetical protein DJ93_4376 [Bacillus clarus]